MALLSIEFFSQKLMVTTRVCAVLPRIGIDENIPDFYQPGRKYPVLWLLHGSCGDERDWINYSNIVRYCEERQVMAVMPSVLNSDYANCPNFADGFAVWDYLNDELPQLVYSWLPASAHQEDNFVAGLSMGGNGALMLALGHPERFAGVAVLSSTAREIEYLRPAARLTAAEFREAAVDPVRFPGPNGVGMRPKEINQVAKYPTVQAFLDSPENAWDRFAEVAESGNMPKLYCSCGTLDKNVYPRFLRFRDYAKQLGVKGQFKEVPGFRHEWALWDREIESAMDFFGLRRK